MVAAAVVVVATVVVVVISSAVVVVSFFVVISIRTVVVVAGGLVVVSVVVAVVLGGAAVPSGGFVRASVFSVVTAVVETAEEEADAETGAVSSGSEVSAENSSESVGSAAELVGMDAALCAVFAIGSNTIPPKLPFATVRSGSSEPSRQAHSVRITDSRIVIIFADAFFIFSSMIYNKIYKTRLLSGLYQFIIKFIIPSFNEKVNFFFHFIGA